MENKNFNTGLREYETMEQLFKRYLDARYYSRDWEEREIYGIISEAAETGDEEAIFYLAEIYSTFPMEYGKKRNRILQYGTTGKTMKALSDAYRYGHYGPVDLKKADEYLTKVGTADKEILYEAILYTQAKGGREDRRAARKMAGEYLAAFSDLHMYEDMKDALIYSLGRRYQIREELVSNNPEEVSEIAKKILNVNWREKTSKEEYGKYAIDLYKEVTTMAMQAFYSKGQYAQAIESLFINWRMPVWVASYIKVLREKAPEGAVEKSYIRAWKQICDPQYNDEAKDLIREEIKDVMAWYKKKGTLSYARFVKLAQQEGCPGAEDYVADMEELL